MVSLFTKIVQGDIPCHKVMEDEDCLAFLDIRPITPGHTLVIPKKEVDYIFDLDERSLSGLIVFAQKVASKIRKSVECERVGIMVAGLEVPHAHIHLVPIRSVGDLNFSNAKTVAADHLAKLAEKIRTA